MHKNDFIWRFEVKIYTVHKFSFQTSMFHLWKMWDMAKEAQKNQAHKQLANFERFLSFHGSFSCFISFSLGLWFQCFLSIWFSSDHTFLPQGCKTMSFVVFFFLTFLIQISVVRPVQPRGAPGPELASFIGNKLNRADDWTWWLHAVKWWKHVGEIPECDSLSHC